MNLAQAIKDLRDDIVSEGFDADVMAEIAKDNGCAPALLERKFEEQYGAHPSKYSAPVPISKEVMIEQAKKAAFAWNQRVMTRQGDVPCGLVFERDNITGEYVTVGWLGNRLAVVRVADCSEYYLNFKNVDSCVRFMEKRNLI